MQLLGAALVFLALADIFLTVLYARSGMSVLSDRLHSGVWRVVRRAALARPSRRDRLLGYAGPVLLVLTVVLWTALLLLGFALIVWPVLGSAIRASSGATSTGFATALYYAGFNLTTLGVGDIVPLTPVHRLLTVLMAVTGFSVLTLSLTFFTSVYSALVRRNTFALSLHHRTLGTADAAVLLAHLGPKGDFSDARSELTTMAEELVNLYESHHFYPVLHYFRFQGDAYALARIVLVSLDTVTLIRSALNEQAYPSLVRSTAVAALWGGGLQLLEGVAATFLPRAQLEEVGALEGDTERAWRAHYRGAVAKLRAEGIAVVADVDAGADKYVALRREWGAYAVAFAAYMLYEWREIATQETTA
jgi:hypothetical protein